MSKPWPMVPLGEVLTLSNNSVPSVQMSSINLAGIYSFGRGLFKRGPMFPTETTYKYFNRLVTDEFVISQPKAWEGAIARVSKEFDGWFLSPVFPTFRVDKQKLEPRFLEWFCRREPVWTELHRKSRGIGARRESVSPGQFLSVNIPLPPLSEQRQIVGRIEQLAGKIEEAQSLRQQTTDEVKRLLICMAHRQDLDKATKLRGGWRRLPLSKCVELVDDSYRVEAVQSYPNLGIYSFGRGLFHKPSIDGALTSAKTLRRVKRGQFIYSRLFAFEGACGMVSDEFNGYFVSGEYPTFECNPDFVRVEFLASYFKSPAVWRDISAGSKGLGDRRQRVQPKVILDYRLWVPPLLWQNLIAETQNKMDELKKQQEKTRAELNALLPAILDRGFKGGL